MNTRSGTALPALAFVLGLAAFLLYWPSLHSGFVYDADIQIKSDSYIHTPAHFADVVTLRVLGQDVLDGTRPAHVFLLMIDSLLWGRQPLGYHLTSNLLHAINVAFLFLLLARLGAQAAPTLSRGRVLLAASLGALLFAVHPVLTEAVSEVSDREDPLAAFFILLPLLLAENFPARTAVRTFLRGTVCVVSLVLAAASKETGFAGPFLLALYAWLFRRESPRKAWIVLLAAAFVAVGAFGAARFGLQPAVSRIFTEKPGYIGGSLGQVFLLQPRVWALLLANAAWPLHLSADYTPQNLAWITLPAAIAALVFFVGAQFLLAMKSRLALLGAVIFWLGLAPVSNFIPIFRWAADRFLYLPMIGLAAMLCSALLLASGRKLFTALCMIALAPVLALVPLAWQRQAVFANSLNLWTDTIKKSPYSATAADNLGYAQIDDGDYQASLNSFERALQITHAVHADAWAGAAIALDKLNRAADAEIAMGKAIANDPQYANPKALVEFLVADQASADAIQKILDRMPAAAKPSAPP